MSFLISHLRILAYNQRLKSLSLEFVVKILLVNNNQVVQKLIDVTTRKVDCELTTLISFEEFEKQSDIKKYDLVVFDQEVLEGYKGDFSFLKGNKSIILYSQVLQDDALLSHFTYTIKKPFLPNEFLTLLVSAKQNLQKKQKEEFANLDEKEMFVNIDAEDEVEKNDDLDDLLNELNIPADHSLANEENVDDDLDALLKDLPEEEGFEQDHFQTATQQEVQTAKEREGEVRELDEIQEEDIQEDALQKDQVLGTQEALDQVAQDENKEVESEKDGDEEYELSKTFDQSETQTQEVEEEDQEEKDSHIGGALDLAEIAKVQNLLDEVQKSGGKVRGESHKEIELFQSLLSSKSPEGIREILDGMQLTINISFPKKEN